MVVNSLTSIRLFLCVLKNSLVFFFFFNHLLIEHLNSRDNNVWLADINIQTLRGSWGRLLWFVQAEILHPLSLSTTTLILINGLFFLLLYALARGCHCDRLGIQIAQLAIIETQLSMVLLSVVLLIGIHKVSEVLLFITSN